MDDRFDLQALLEETLGSSNVYFQPPESFKMKYPAIVYFRKEIENVYANNYVYRQNSAYEIIVIYEDPDSDIPGKISKLAMCRHDRHYTRDNLNHDVFTLYF